MQRFPDADDLVLSATDLTSFLACRRLTQEALKAALGLRGRLPRDDSPHGDLVRRHGDEYEQQEVTACAFVPLLGRFGWADGGG